MKKTACMLVFALVCAGIALTNQTHAQGLLGPKSPTIAMAASKTQDSLLTVECGVPEFDGGEWSISCRGSQVIFTLPKHKKNTCQIFMLHSFVIDLVQVRPNVWHLVRTNVGVCKKTVVIELSKIDGFWKYTQTTVTPAGGGKLCSVGTEVSEFYYKHGRLLACPVLELGNP